MERVLLPEEPTMWRRVFVPSQTRWGADMGAVCTAEKADALDVLFLKSPHFLKAGVRVVQEYMEWCDAHCGGDYRLMNPSKAKGYLEHRVDGAYRRWHEGKEAGASKHNTPEEAGCNAFRAAICHLDALARWQGYPMSLLETEPIRVLRDRIHRAQNGARAEAQDYAASSRFLTKRLTQEQMEAITECWWDGSAAERVAATAAGQERAQMRGLLLHCLQKHIGRRGGDLRNLRLAMFFAHRLPHTRPVDTCPVLGASLRHVKECADNVEHLLGWARAKDRLACPLGALACYLVWQNDLGGGAPILAEIRRDLQRGGEARAWWKRMLFGDAKEAPIAYSTHHKAVAAGYGAGGITGMTAATHVYRNTVGCEQIEAGTAFTDVGVYQGWYHDNAADRYLRGAFKSAPLLKAHGWEDGVDGFACWWEGAEDDVPQALRDAVFPGLEKVLEAAERAYEETQVDRSAVEFLKALVLLRRWFLEDAVCKRRQFPGFPPYARHPVFQLAEWPEYCHAEEGRIRQRQERAKKNETSAMIASAVAGAMAGAVADAVAGAVNGALQKALESMQDGKRRRAPAPAPEQLVHAPVEAPRPPEELPELPEPTCLYTCYAHWQEHRSYFYEHTTLPWKKRFGERATALKLRYSRMRPFLMYLDRCGAGARRALDALEALRKERGVAPSVFIKQCFYYLEYRLSADCKKPPPILPDDMRARMRREGLPEVVTTASV